MPPFNQYTNYLLLFCIQNKVHCVMFVSTQPKPAMSEPKPRQRAPGGGRKKRYDEPTKVVPFRIPLSRIDEIKQVVKTLLTTPKP